MRNYMIIYYLFAVKKNNLMTHLYLEYSLVFLSSLDAFKCSHFRHFSNNTFSGEFVDDFNPFDNNLKYKCPIQCPQKMRSIYKTLSPIVGIQIQKELFQIVTEK